MKRFGLTLVLALLVQGAWAQSWHVPQRGTADRTGMMDAIRPHVEWLLGAPVQFVVRDLRVSGDLGYAALHPQRPGGAAISLWNTPGHRRGVLDPEMSDGVHTHVLYRRSGATWVAVEWSVGATDVWFSAPELCAVWRPVIAEFCGG